MLCVNLSKIRFDNTIRLYVLTLWGRYKMAAILQTTFSRFFVSRKFIVKTFCKYRFIQGYHFTAWKFIANKMLLVQQMWSTLRVHEVLQRMFIITTHVFLRIYFQKKTQTALFKSHDVVMTWKLSTHYLSFVRGIRPSCWVLVTALSFSL